MKEENQKPHCNKLPTDPDELLAFVAKGLEGEAKEVDLTERFYKIVDDLIKDGFEFRKQA